MALADSRHSAMPVTTPWRRIAPLAPSMACRKPPPILMRPLRSFRSTKLPPPSCNGTRRLPQHDLGNTIESTSNSPMSTRPNPASEIPWPPREENFLVLLVDDQAMVAEAIRRMLANEPGINFHYCSDPNEAVVLAQQLRVSVILQDLVM